MGPKKETAEVSWKKVIENAALNDIFWNAKVMMIDCAATDQDRIYLGKFETAAADEKRFVIKNISRSQTMFMIKQLGGEKKVKDDTLLIFEECQAFVKEKADIPSSLMALTIKYLMLKMKDEYLFIKRQRLHVKEGLQRESTTMIDKSEVRGTVAVKTEIPVEIVKPKGKGKKAEVEPPAPGLVPEEGKKYNTRLRVRGEEWRDKVYVDDYPVDGPNLYIAITGFEDPFLCESLVKIGVRVTAVIQIRIDPGVTKVPNDLMHMSKRGQSETHILMEKSLKYWEDFQQERIRIESSEYLKHTAFLIFTPPYWEDSNLSGDPETIYDELCYFMYDIQDLSRQHLTYLECIDVIKIPTETLNANLTSYYNRYIEHLPLESTTIYSVLDGVLQAIIDQSNDNHTVSIPESSSESPNKLEHASSTEEKHGKALSIVKQIFNELNNDQENKVYRPTFGYDYENYKGPLIINYGDYSKNTTFHLQYNNLNNIVYRMMLGIPLHKLWNNFVKSDEELQAKRNYHTNVLLSCCDQNDVKYSKLIRLLNILACRKLYEHRSSKLKRYVPLKSILEFKKVYLKRSILSEAIPNAVYNMTDTPLPSMVNVEEEQIYETTTTSAESEKAYYPFDCPDISELVTADEINKNNNVCYITDDYNYFEDFSGITSFQVIQDVFSKYNCVDYKYCEITDSIILMFFNSHDRNGVQYEEWRYHLPTPICFQDYYDFIFEEKYEWTIRQEKMYEEKMYLKKQSECSEFIDIFASTSCIDNLEVGYDMLIDGSLKHKEYFNNISIDSQSTDKFSKKSTMPSFGSESAKKKNKSIISSTPKSIVKDSKDMTAPPIVKDFIGYELGDRRVEVLGKDTYFYSKDGTKILIVYYTLIPTNIEYISLEITPGNGGSVIRVHKVLGYMIPYEHLDVDKSFFVTCEDGLIINVLKENYQVAQHSPLSLNHSQEFLLSEPSGQSRYYHRSIVTWPNGLVIETVHEEHSAIISHIKQHYLKPLHNLSEDMRCISRHGEVILFKSNNHIETLRPDGTKILITKCEKRVTKTNISNHSTASHTTVNKHANKNKVPKPSKSPKSRSESPSKVDLKPLEYELHIEEFGISDTQGHHQTFVENAVKELEKRLIRTITDYNLPEIYYRTMDGTKVVIDRNSVQTVTFQDNTRIISILSVDENEFYPDCLDEDRQSNSPYAKEKNGTRSTQPSSSNTSEFIDEEFDIILDEEEDEGYLLLNITYIVEHPNFATITVEPNGTITVDSPNETSVHIKEGSIDIKLDESTRCLFDGVQLHINYEYCKHNSLKTTCDINICNDDEIDDSQSWWMKMKDSFCKEVTVDHEGALSVSDGFANSKDEFSEKNYEQASKVSSNVCTYCTSLVKSRQLNQRFFILRRDLTSSELVHRDTVGHYLQTYYNEPWYSLNTYAAFEDHRDVMSVITPIHLNESEKWLMDSKLSNPPHYKIIKSKQDEIKKGFYHWMRPYGRFEPKPIKPQNVLPPRLPRAYVLRTLEQFWQGQAHEQMRGGRELVQAILKYRELLQKNSAEIPNESFRTDFNEDIFKMTVKNFSRWVCMNLKNRLDEHMLANLKPSITTKELIIDSESLCEIMEEEESINGDIFEDPEIHRRELERLENTCRNLRKYWRIRAEQKKEEEFNKYLLRQGDVPPYFRNILGGAIRCELTTVADNVIDMLINKE